MTTLRVAFIWHMHQPWYLWPGGRQAVLPFVRLHACGSYYDMPWLLRDFDKTTVTFNLVPSLTEQIARYARGQTTDRILELSRRPSANLEPDEQHYLVDCFRNFCANASPELSARRAELLHKCKTAGTEESTQRAGQALTDGDCRDLQVWLNLAWCGYGLRTESEVVRELQIKDRGFTEDEKLALLDEMQAAMERVLDLYRSAESEGKAELTTSPYYHPILPLLCEMSDAQQCIPRGQLPEELWQAPEECRRQLERARAHHEMTFGARPRGLWPSEGAVSDAVLSLIEEAGFAWTASDEEILAHSLRAEAGGRLGPDNLYRPYRVADGDLAIVFRDHHLSDRIGFLYRYWRCDDAAEDLVGRLRAIASAFDGAGVPGLVCILLDGENPWGWYPDRGEGFLRSVYRALEADEIIETTSVADYLREFPPQVRLDSVFPGSWIDHSYRTWIGSEEHGRAWRLLRGALNAARRAETGEALERAREHLMIAEGSDWFWWYSEQHHTEASEVFDALFRANVAEVYRALGEREPERVNEPIAQAVTAGLAREALGLMRADIDGRVSTYFEWQPAALLSTRSLASEMHQGELIVREVFFGCDLENLWLRVDTSGRASTSLRGYELQFVFPGEPECRLTLALPRAEAQARLAGELAGYAEAMVDRIVEARISLEALGAGPGSTIEFAVRLQRSGQPHERWPQHGFLTLSVPTEDSSLHLWVA